MTLFAWFEGWADSANSEEESPLPSNRRRIPYQPHRVINSAHVVYLPNKLPECAVYLRVASYERG